ncbi:MAG: flagellar biosynthetic protein FliQ [Pararhodobacter sp.]|nr:flagellar biosynthetic protein FliQ [Pararhodobacter sp.]
MSDVAFFDVLRQGLWVAVAMAAPILAVALITGLAVGLMQALTSVQEMTLTFVPKIIAMLIVFWVSMSFMTGLLVSFFGGHVLPLIRGV